MIIYKLANFKHINNQDFNIEDFIDKVLVVDLKDVSKSSSESIKNVLRKLNDNIALSLVPSKKIIKNEQFLHILEKTLRNIDTLFVDEAYLNEKLVDILEISKTKYITLSPKTKCRCFVSLKKSCPSDRPYAKESTSYYFICINRSKHSPIR